MAEGLNPLNYGKYLSVNVNGQWMGPGGAFRSTVQVLSGLISSLAPAGKPLEDLWSANAAENPIIGWLGSRGAMGQDWLKTVTEGITGKDAQAFEDIEGAWDIVPHMATSYLPMVIEGIMEGDKWWGVASGEVGARTTPSTPSDLYEAKMKDAFFKKTPEELAPYYTDEDAPGTKFGIVGEALEAATGGKIDMDRSHKWPDREDGRRVWKRDVPKDLQADLREDNPEIEEAYRLDKEYQIERGGSYGKYLEEKEGFTSERDQIINNAAKTFGPSESLRQTIDAQNGIYRT